MMEKSLVGRDKHLILLTLPGDPTISRYPVTDSKKKKKISGAVQVSSSKHQGCPTFDNLVEL